MKRTQYGAAISLSGGMVYGVTWRVLHWLMALLIIGLLLAIQIKGELPKGDLKHLLIEWHKQAGLLVLLLVWLRLSVRIFNAAPSIEPPLSAWTHQAAELVHKLFYLMMIVIPLLGILFSQAKGKDVDFLGWRVPLLLDEDSGLPYALVLKTAHEWLGTVMMYLIGFHIGSALFHHWIRRDNTLMRMLGFQKRAAERFESDDRLTIGKTNDDT